ncbi:hypothetical protein K458DRAFT_492313 [Lentithecium fluviatile CBS 122367]|uniref:DUF7770 domain-containing protein n=1 Tax=Lentithecium fluviatile CBS 122367 TaxID=1168545 RepID=A0A6G1IF51_9PLEO|nr:hypothetical protein K458DRAFT_492313 [Lentithecium fluviatile CBS 122367]
MSIKLRARLADVYRYFVSINCIDCIGFIDFIDFIDFISAISAQNSNLFAQIAAQQQAALAAAAANPVTYVPASKTNEIREKLVLKIYAVCHPIMTTSGTGKTNHWTLSFDVGNRQGVRVDIQPDPRQHAANGGNKAYVIVSLLDYLITNKAERADPVSVTYQRSVGWYVDYLASGGRFKYIFTPQGIGCRKWVTDTLKLLADVGEANKTEVDTATRALAYTWPDNRPAEPAAGTYF